MDELRCSGSIAGRSAVCVRFTADLINFPWENSGKRVKLQGTDPAGIKSRLGSETGLCAAG